MAQLSALGRCAISAGEPASEAWTRWPVSCQPAWEQDLSQFSGISSALSLASAALQLSFKRMVIVWSSRTHIFLPPPTLPPPISPPVLEIGLETEIASSSGWVPHLLQTYTEKGMGSQSSNISLVQGQPGICAKH